METADFELAAVELFVTVAGESLRAVGVEVAGIGSAELEVIAGYERFQANEFEAETVAAAEIGGRAISDDERDLEAGVVLGTAAVASFYAAVLAVVAAARDVLAPFADDVVLREFVSLPAAFASVPVAAALLVCAFLLPFVAFLLLRAVFDLAPLLASAPVQLVLPPVSSAARLR